MYCKICNKEIRYFNKHLNEIHNITGEEYYDTYIDNSNHECAEKNCHKKAKFLSVYCGYNKCCSQKCANRLSTTERHKNVPIFGLEKAQKTNLILYGNVCSLHGTEQIKAKKKTWKIKYGEEHPCRSEEIQDKIITTKMKNNNCKTKEEYYEILQNQIKETLKKQYGCNEDGTQKIVNVFQLETSKKKAKETKYKRYGNENYSNHDKACKTLMELYGSIFNNPKFKYDNKFFDSSYELVYYIYLKDNNINFEYHPKHILTYFWSGDNKYHKYFPDFIVENKIIELKNDFVLNIMKTDLNSKEHAKYKCMLENNVDIISNNEIKPYIDYVSNKYGNKYIEQFKIIRENNGTE